MLKYTTAGESHGKSLAGILEGLPAGVPINIAEVNAALKRRQSGFGRGARMKIESDSAEVISGVRGGFTTGAPLCFLIRNRDYENWQKFMDAEDIISGRELTALRPGHADYAGCKKYGFTDARNVLERASARETAARVAAGAFSAQFLKALGVSLASCVTAIGGEVSGFLPQTAAEILKSGAYGSAVSCPDGAAAARMEELIKAAQNGGDTLGGAARVVIDGLPAGLGSHVARERKLDAALAFELMSVQSVKAVSFGAYGEGRGRGGCAAAGSLIHDEMFPGANGSVTRKTNNAGGIEGGMTNGESVIINVEFKPIPTVMKGLNTVDLLSGQAVISAKERSDACAVPAAAAVAEYSAAFVAAAAALERTGGDNLGEVLERWKKLF